MPVEIPLREKYRMGHKGRQRAPYGGRSGVNRHRGETRKDVKTAQQQATRDNQMALFLDGSRNLKRRWIRAADIPKYLGA